MPLMSLLWGARPNALQLAHGLSPAQNPGKAVLARLSYGLPKAILWTAYGLFSVQSKKEQPHQADIHHFGGAETQLGGIYSVTVSTVWLNPPDFNNVLICRNQIIPITPNYL